MDTVRNLKVFKKPRVKPLLDIPINFPALKNLHLELMEIKDKLKKNLPLIPVSKPIMPAPKEESESSEEELKPGPIMPKSDDNVEEENHKKDKKDKKSKKEKHVKKKSKKSKKPDAIVEDLGEDSSESDEDSESSDESSNNSKDTSGDSSKDTSGDSTASSAGSDKSQEEAGSEPKEPEEYDPYAGLSPEEREVKEKEEFIWRFRILKKQYGRNATIPIPEWNEHSDLSLMKTSYERTIRELYLDDAVEQYRTYLIGGWMVMEYVCTQFIGIDLRGFTVQQSQMMYKYDRMLIELGEKSYTRWGTNLPVEIRLLGLILFQAGIFYLGKVLTDKFGNSAAEMFRGFTGQPTPPPNTPQQPSPNTQSSNTTESQSTNTPPKSRMRGPKISADDIRSKNKPEDV